MSPDVTLSNLWTIPSLFSTPHSAIEGYISNNLLRTEISEFEFTGWVKTPFGLLKTTKSSFLKIISITRAY